MKIEAIKLRINEILELANLTLSTTYNSSGSDYVSSTKFNEFRSASLSFLKSTFGTDHPYYDEFNNNVKDINKYYVEFGIGILNAVKNEIDGGWIFTVKGLLSAEIFSDFLEMAEYLLNEKYKDPAAVMIGSVLEGHLRQLCSTNNVPIVIIKGDKPIPKKADLLNTDLSNAMIYNKLDQKCITSWLDLRNKAAHGKYDEYTLEQVQLMLQGVLNFISRTT